MDRLSHDHRSSIGSRNLPRMQACLTYSEYNVAMTIWEIQGGPLQLAVLQSFPGSWLIEVRISHHRGPRVQRPSGS